MQNETKQQELEIKTTELELQKYKVDQDNATRITVAQLNAYRGVQEMDQDSNGIPDPIEIGKRAIEQQKIDAAKSTKQMELNNKAKELSQRYSIEKDKIKLEKERMLHETQLQKMSDAAAMAREELKAKTALKNKVAGEK